MEDMIRTGFVSSVDTAAGTVQVTYADRDQMVTGHFPVLCFGGEYHLPEINDPVLAVHLSTDLSSGFVLGTYWNQENRPRQQEWYKQAGAAAFKLAGEALYIEAPEIYFISGSGSISASELIALKDRVERLERNG